MGNHQPAPYQSEDLAVLCLLVGAGFGGLGLLLLSVIVYTDLPDYYGLTALMSFGLMSIGITLLCAVSAMGIARRLLPGPGRRFAATRAALILGGAVISMWAWGMVLDWLSNQGRATGWVLSAVAVAVVVGAVASLRMTGSRPGVVAITFVAGTAAVFAWGLATVISLNVTSTPTSVREGQSAAHIEFDAMASGDYEVRLEAAGCSDGRVLATGRYGPGWDETSTDVDRAQVDIPRAALEEGTNAIRICLRDGIRLGQASLVIEVDEMAPLAPTLAAEPVTQAGSTAIARTRSLQFSGTADPEAELELRLDGNEFSKPRVVGGRWTDQWQFASTTEGVTVEVMSRDRAGNESRSAPLTIRFESDDPPAVFSAAYPSIALECRGRASTLTASACRDWGAAALDAKPGLVPSIVRVVLTDDAEGCAAILVGVREVLVSYERMTCPSGV